MHRTLPGFVLACALLAGSNARASVIFTGSPYSQNFDTLATSGTSNAWTNDSTLLGWHLFRQPTPGTAITTYAAGTGSSNTGSFYSFGSAASTERALGGLGSGGAYFGSPATGAVAGWIALSIQNGTGTTLDNFTVSFDGEQWRNGGNTSSQTMVFEYGFGSTFDTVSWTAPGGLFDWSSVINTATAGAVDGNSAGLVANRGGAIGNLSWAAGDTLWMRWIERNDAGNDHGLAIDDFSFTVVPEPSSIALAGLGLGGFALLARRRKRA